MCLHGPNGCLVPSRPGEGATDLVQQYEELEVKLSGLAKKRSAEIETFLNDQRKNEDGVIKILLLGGPSSGKSTIFKQMRIIHKDGFKRPDQLEFFSELINSNVCDIFHQLVQGARSLGIALDAVQADIDLINAKYCEMRSDPMRPLRLTRSLAAVLRRFWLSDDIQKAFSQRYAFTLMDSTRYFLDNLERIGDENYQPLEEDIVHSRQATTNINSTNFTYSGLKLRLVDVGGQKSQRRKWLHLFDDVRVVLFVVDLTGYAKKSDVNKDGDLMSAMKIFHDVATNRVLRQAVFLLFLNKVDLYEELLQSVQFSGCFNDYKGANNLEETTAFLREKCMQAAKPRKAVFPHCTTATNTQNIKLVFRACMESVFKANSKATGLV